MKKKYTLCLLLAWAGISASAQTSLSLDSCRALALQNNKELAAARLSVEKSEWDRKAARTNYFPKISLTAGYMRTGDQVSLLSKDQKKMLGSLGTTASNGFQQMAQQLVTQHPELAPLVQGFSGLIPQIGQMGNALGQGLIDALHTDNRNMTAGAILLTQPLYMGGKIKAYERITQYQKQLAADRLDASQQALMLDVEKAYWQVVSLVNKRRLAVGYRDMLARLDSDMVKMIDEGVATRSNGLAVSVKLNEAEMTLTKVDDGLTLSRMLLCQLCGIPLTNRPTLADEASENLSVQSEATVNVQDGISQAYALRPELRQLQLAQQIYTEKARVERSAHLPQLALTGGYAISNPNVFNSFEKKFRGTWSVGILLKVPVWNWGETRYKVRSAKTEAMMASLQSEEAREKIELQVTQEAFRVNEADRKLALSLKSLDKAEENLRVAQVGFHEGVINTTDLLQAQTAWLQAHSDKIDAQIDTKITRAAYRKAIGQR